MEELVTAYFTKDVSGEGATLYKHLCDVLGKAIDEKPADVVSVFEKLSMELKYARFRPAPGPDKQVPAVLGDPVAQKELADVRAKISALAGAEYTGTAAVASFLSDAAVLANAGVGFNSTESYQISLQLLGMAKKLENLVSLRFFGKVLGTDADYWVFEGVLAGTGVAGAGVEPRGTGANKATYWVSNSALGELTQLPDVRSGDIVSAKQIRKLLSGDLNAPVRAVPYFAGKEINLLRAQIAQIASDCTLHVNGFYVQNDESGALEAAEEFALPGPDDLAGLGSWVHTVDFILDNGATSYPDAESLGDDEAAVAALNAQMEACPPQPILRSAAEDAPVGDEGSAAWRAKVVGDKSAYAFPEGERRYSTTVLASTRWPGACVAAGSSSGRVVNFYCGYGYSSRNDKPEMPLIVPFLGATQMGPGAVMTEPKEQEECPEPNPPEEIAADDGGEFDEKRDGD